MPEEQSAASAEHSNTSEADFRRRPSPASSTPETDLLKLKGIGPKWASTLTEAGVSLQDIAEWTEDDIDRWDDKLKAVGKIRSFDWRGQAIDILTRPEGEEAEVPAHKLPKPVRGRFRRRLNKNQRYSSIIGQHEVSGTAWEQMRDGKMVQFNNAGYELFPDGDNEDIDPKDVEQPVQVTPENVHFLNWLDNKADYSFGTVQKAIHRFFGGKKVIDEKGARQFLHETMRGNN